MTSPDDASRPPTIRRAVVLLSGGLDSTTTLAMALRDGFECHALSFDYGQRHSIELDAARAVVAAMGVRAKIRTGGGTAEAFPSCADLAHFLQACATANVPFKATAGLHHPVRSMRPLTAGAESPSAMMHGFVNVFLAARRTRWPLWRRRRQRRSASRRIV